MVRTDTRRGLSIGVRKITRKVFTQRRKFNLLRLWKEKRGLVCVSCERNSRVFGPRISFFFGCVSGQCNGSKYRCCQCTYLAFVQTESCQTSADMHK